MSFIIPFSVNSVLLFLVLSLLKYHWLKRLYRRSVASFYFNNPETCRHQYSPSYYDGNGINAYFSSPSGIAVDSSGNIFVADTGNNRIRKINQTGYVSTFAGTGSYYDDSPYSVVGVNQANIAQPKAIAVSSQGVLYFTSQNAAFIRKIENGYVSRVAGNSISSYQDGAATNAYFSQNLYGIGIDGKGDIYVMETGSYDYNSRIRKIILSNGNSSVITISSDCWFCWIYFTFNNC